MSRDTPVFVYNVLGAVSDGRNRRQWLRAMGAIGLAAAGLPTTAADPVDVVKILSFSCSFCRDSEVHDGAIARAAAERGGRFVWAPVPTHPEDRFAAKERVYYAARDMNARLGQAVKQSLYKGTQDQGQVLFDYMPIYAWLVGDIPQHARELDTLIEKARGPESHAALQRAIRLAVNAGVDAVPAYVLLRGGRVVETIDRNHPRAPTLSALRELVIESIDKHTQEK